MGWFSSWTLACADHLLGSGVVGESPIYVVVHFGVVVVVNFGSAISHRRNGHEMALVNPRAHVGNDRHEDVSLISCDLGFSIHTERS